MILIGLDDTDTLESPGTNQLAKAIVRAASPAWRCLRIVRHQLFFDPRVPYTSKNGSASIALEQSELSDVASLIALCEQFMQDWFIAGSDPGLCVATSVSAQLTEFGLLCQRAVVTQHMAQDLAMQHGVFLKGLGGTNGGVIGALAAVGLAVAGNDGRVVQHGTWPDDLSRTVPVESIVARDIHVIEADSDVVVTHGFVDVGKHLRPNRRGGGTVLFVKAEPGDAVKPFYRALKLT